MRKHFLPFFILLFISNFSFSQLSGISLSYGLGGINNLNNKLHFPSHQIHLDYNQYLARSISAGVNLHFQNSNINKTTIDSLQVNKYNSFGIDFNFKWWFLNDFRLMGTMAKSSCKGKLVALSYNFRMYLLGNVGYSFNLTKNSNIRKGSAFAGGGIGINIFQWGLSKYGGSRIHQGVKHLLIPFVEVIYDYYFKNMLNSDLAAWKPHTLNIKVGVKLAFTYF